MANESSKPLLDCYLAEYGKHRDEIANRINLQN